MGAPARFARLRRSPTLPWTTLGSDASLAGVARLAELERTRQELDRHRATLAAQQRQPDAVARQRLATVSQVGGGIKAFRQPIDDSFFTCDTRDSNQPKFARSFGLSSRHLS